MSLKRALSPFVLGLALFCSPLAGAENNPAELKAQLDALEAEIQKYRKMLDETRSARSELESTLETNEKDISDLLKRIEEIEKELRAGDERIGQLSREQQVLGENKAEQQALIASQIRAAYKVGKQEYLKVVLNQEDPNQVARMLTYYDYLNAARANQVETYQQTITDLDRVTAQIAEQQEQRLLNRTALRQQRASLQLVQEEKEATLVQLNREIARTGDAIQQREQDRERLEGLLERITANVANLPSPTDTKPFTERRGDMLFPVAGTITNRFGSRRTGKMQWNGIFIEATEGEPVSAVHYGRVVFSDWLRGFGLLLIINHGDGYMSLYGHNQVLYREPGDWVVAGETIATVGNTGGQERAGVYFEIRHAGKPTDPQHWCKARPQGTA